MNIRENLLAIIQELEEDAKQIENEQLQLVAQFILKTKRIFIAGADRTGFAARAFSNRLMHLGFAVNFIGEPTTPSIQKKIYS